MNDPFLVKVRVSSEGEAMRNALRAALQHNPVYLGGVSLGGRREIRKDWADQITQFARDCVGVVSERDLVDRIGAISDSLSQRHEHALRGGRLRFGTSQKALNLYLKLLWRLGKIARPPHCPVDRIVLRYAGITGSWTSSDSVDEYLEWIRGLEKAAEPMHVADWEYELWNKSA